VTAEVDRARRGRRGDDVVFCTDRVGEIGFLGGHQVRRSDFIEAMYAFALVLANFGIAMAAKMR